MLSSTDIVHHHSRTEPCATLKTFDDLNAKINLQIEEKELDSAEIKLASDIYEHLELHGLAIKDAGQICWADDSKFHPRAWHLSRKLYNTSFVILYEAFRLVKNTFAVEPPADYYLEAAPCRPLALRQLHRLDSSSAYLSHKQTSCS